MPSVVRKCAVCGKDFQIFASWVMKCGGAGKYCSRECMAEGYRTAEKRICIVCGKSFSFHKARERRGDAGIYCSLACRDFGHSQKRDCPICGKEYKTQTIANHKFCSSACYQKSRTKQRMKRNCLYCGKEFSFIPTRLKWQAKMFCSYGCSIKSKNPTSIELLGNKYLDELGLSYQAQHKIGRFWIDAFLPEHRLAIEWDGKYWHSTPRGIETGMRKDEYLSQSGIAVLRIGEDEIKHNPIMVKEKIISAIG